MQYVVRSTFIEVHEEEKEAMKRSLRRSSSWPLMHSGLNINDNEDDQSEKFQGSLEELKEGDLEKLKDQHNHNTPSTLSAAMSSTGYSDDDDVNSLNLGEDANTLNRRQLGEDSPKSSEGFVTYEGMIRETPTGSPKSDPTRPLEPPPQMVAMYLPQQVTGGITMMTFPKLAPTNLQLIPAAGVLGSTAKPPDLLPAAPAPVAPAIKKRHTLLNANASLFEGPRQTKEAPLSGELEVGVISQLLTMAGHPAAPAKEFAMVVGEVCKATTGMLNVELHLPIGGRREVLVTADGDNMVFELVQLVKKTLLAACSKTQSTYVKGYLNEASIFQPSISGDGYEATCSFVPPEDVDVACWDIHQKGFCCRGRTKACRWTHPNVQLTFRVALIGR